MKYILISLLILSSHTFAGDKIFFAARHKPNNLLLTKGDMLAGKISTFTNEGKQISNISLCALEQIHIVGSVERLPSQIAGAVSLFTELNLGHHLWASSSREEIVQFGRPKEERIFLFSGPGDNPETLVSGKLVYDDTDNSFTARGLKFSYLPGPTGAESLDIVDGFIEEMPYPKLDGSQLIYRTQWHFRDAATQSNDSLFNGKMEGLITVVYDKDDKSKFDTYIDLSGENLTEFQVVAFMKWFASAVFPLQRP